MYLSRNDEPDYEGGAVMANAALPVGETMELFAFGGFSRRSAVSDELYRKADWVPRNVSYVYPDGFFPTKESDLTDASLAGGLRSPSRSMTGSGWGWARTTCSTSCRRGSRATMWHSSDP